MKKRPQRDWAERAALREKIAVALWETRSPEALRDWDNEKSWIKDYHYKQADAVLAALAAPSAPSLPVPGPVSDTTIHHGIFPPAPSGAAQYEKAPIGSTRTIIVGPDHEDAARIYTPKGEINAYWVPEIEGRTAFVNIFIHGDLTTELEHLVQGTVNPSMAHISIGEAAAPKPAPLDHSRCSLCGAPRIALNRAGTLFGACTLVDCKDPLYDFRVENPNAAIVNDSRSQQKRVAAMKGEPMPTFEPAPCELCGGTGKFKDASLADAPTQPCPCGPTPAPGAERPTLADLAVHEGECAWCGWPYKKFLHEYDCPAAVKLNFPEGQPLNDSYSTRRTRVGDVREALAAAPPAPTDTESLAATFHDIYQQEAKRQGDVRHKDAYAELPDNVKEFDRVLARYVLANFGVEDELMPCDRCQQKAETVRVPTGFSGESEFLCGKCVSAMLGEAHELMEQARVKLRDRHASAERVRELIAKWRNGEDNWTVDRPGHSLAMQKCADELELALPPSTGEKHDGD